MTRETKIGLLVGLAFIIVIGILLSDHLTSSTEPPQAALTNSGNTVRGTVVSPGASQSPIVTNVQPPTVQLQHQVPTPRELQLPTPANEIIKIGAPSILTQSQPAAAQTQTPLTAAPAIVAVTNPPAQINEPVRVSSQHPIQQNPAPQPQEVLGADMSNNAIVAIARSQGEQVISATPGGIPQRSASGNGAREYVAEPGDSLSKIAAKVYGTSSKAAKDAIVAANPFLAEDPNKTIYVGKTYRIPALPTAQTPAAAPAPAVQTVAAQPKPATPAVQQPKSASANENWYTVQPGDTLTRIARDQLGDSSAIPAILELNRETLKDPNNLSVNMKLRLPGKSVAQAN